MRKILPLLLLNVFFSINIAYSQISKGGIPRGFGISKLNEGFQQVELFADMNRAAFTEKSYNEEITAHRIGFTISTSMNTVNSGKWYPLENGDKIWKLAIKSSKAEALTLYFENFEIPDGAELFLYNEQKNQILGAYTSSNNNERKLFATELIKGDLVILEYYLPKGVTQKDPFTINEVGYIYRDTEFDTGSLKAFGDSENCEVNINCVEGESWQQQKKGVARILVKKGDKLSWCTGSLVNNTSIDLQPLFLTANHCGSGASADDYANWIFYFNYESENCENPVSEPASNSILGASLKASGSTNGGSDFKLLLLNQEVPEDWNPYYNGWDRSMVASSSGVGIHHPFGDIKKISTYTSPLVSSVYDGSSENPDGMFWRVNWSETTNGHGVTEGGSSGSPIFNTEGLIVGTLTGGTASCTNTSSPDYYGKISYSWESNGNEDVDQLKPFLDPGNRGHVKLAGVSPHDVLFIPEFKVDTTHVPIGQSLVFTDFSIGNPESWEWKFEGGNPNKSTLQTPPPIKYEELGAYDVTLIIRKDTRVDSLKMEDYVRVMPIVGPTPTRDKITVYLGTTAKENLIITLFDESGREIEKYEPQRAIKSLIIDLRKYSSGYYFLRVQGPNFLEMHKVVKL